MESKQSEAAQKIYDAVTQFEPMLHFNDGDHHDSQTTATWLRRSKAKIERCIEHLNSIPFQPDR